MLYKKALWIGIAVVVVGELFWLYVFRNYLFSPLHILYSVVTLIIAASYSFGAIATLRLCNPSVDSEKTKD